MTSSSRKDEKSQPWLDPDVLPSDSSEGQPAGAGGPRASRCNDWQWIIVWALQLTTLLAIGIISFARYHTHFEHDGPSDPVTTNDRGASPGLTWTTFFLIMTLVSLALVWSLVFLMLLRHHTRAVIQVSLVTFGLFLTALFVYLIVMHKWVGVVLIGLCIPLHIWFCFAVQEYIPFTVAIVETVTKVVMDMHRSVLGVACGALFVQCLWFFIWSIASLSIYLSLGIEFENGRPVSSSTETATKQVITAKFVGILFLLLISLFWTFEAIRNVLHTTVAGVIASYYFTPQVDAPVGPALKRSLTTSFGSILLASLITSIVKAIRWTFQLVSRWLMSDEPNCLTIVFVCIVECLLKTIEAIVEYFNSYALSFVGIYGRSYFQSATSAYHLMQRRGLDAVLNDDLVGMVIFLGALIAGVVCGAVAVGVALMVGQDWLVWMVIGAVVGLLLSLTIFSVLNSGVITLFVCLAADPAALKQNRPEVYERIVPDLQRRYENIDLQPIRDRKDERV